VTDVLAHEVVARAGDDARLLDVAEPVQHLRHLHRDGRLPGAGVAGERHVQRRPLRGQADLPAELVDQEQRRDLADAGLDGLERDQLAVELVEHLDDVRLVEDGAEIGRLGNSQRRVGLVVVDVVLLGFGRRRHEALRAHAELEAHAVSASGAGLPLKVPRPFAVAGASPWTSR
jgi:hypothetical protein